MQRYEHYSPSGVEWIGEIPANWEVRPGFTCFDENKDRNKRLEEKTVLSLSYGRIVIKPEEKMTGLVPESFESYQLIKPGDIVIRTTDLQNDKTSLRVGLARDRGMITSAYLGLRCKSDVNAELVFRLLESYDALKVFYGMGSGLRQNIDFWDFKRLPIPLPPRDEQDRIVAFLDQKTAEIDAAIAKKKRLIELLQEQKGILINQAVTRGLNPDVPMQDSGVEWIGVIPAHWECAPMKRFWAVLDCKHVTVPFVEEGIPLASVSEVQSFELDLARAKKTTEKHYQKLIEGDRQPGVGDLIYCRNTSVGAAAYVSSNERLAMGQDVCLIRSAKHNGRYLNHFLRSPAMQTQLEMVLVGSTFKRINVSDIKTLIILCPPRSEQDLIEKHISDLCGDIDPVIKIAESEIRILREFRQTVIAGAVTGKFVV